MDRVNVFNPFDSRSDHHEDRLTWAFLVALKYDPFLQNFLRELTESQLPQKYRRYSNTWEPARIATQTKWIESSTTRFVSVLLSDAPIQEEIRVDWSDREPRYDGVIEYPNRMTLIIENKLRHDDVWKEQLSPSRASLPDGIINDVTLHDLAVCLEWSEILEGVLKYTDSGIAPFGSREVARDFLSFVEASHPELTPYRTFSLCGDRHEALSRRTIRLIDDIAKRTGSHGDTWSLYRPGKIAERVGIDIPKTQPWRLQLYLWPASTAGQADRFREKVNKERFLSLNEQGWRVEPNLNFSFMGTKLIWGTTDWKTRRYLEYFFSGGRPYGRKRWDELSPLVAEWKCQGLISSRNWEDIESQRSETNREYLEINPEFEVYREWNLDEVIELEEQGKLEAHVIDALAMPLATWEEHL